MVIVPRGFLLPRGYQERDGALPAQECPSSRKPESLTKRRLIKQYWTAGTCLRTDYRGREKSFRTSGIR